MAITAEQAQTVYQAADCIFDSEEVAAALDRMATAITGKLAARDPLALCVMTGGMIPATELLLRLNFPLQIDYIHATRYGAKTQGGELEWIARPRVSLAGRVVVVIDDILDEGRTLDAILQECRHAGASEVYSAVLVEKDHNRRDGLQQADFTGLKVPDRYVFGYGMDYKGYLRNAPGIYAVREND